MLRTQNAPAILTALLFTAALYLGGAAAPAVPLCASLAILALAATGWNREALRDRLVWAGLLVLGVMALQVIPLPPFLLKLLDARSEAISARALAPLRQDLSGAWRPLHLDPANGRAMLQYGVGLLAAYIATRKAVLRGHAPAIRLAAAWSSTGIAILALAHKLTGQTELFGLYRPREAAPELLAPLLNPNQLSAYTGVGAILWAGFALEGQFRSIAVPLAVLCGAVCAASTSRGGVGGAIVGLAVLAFLYAALQRRTSLRRGGKEMSGAIQVGVLSAMILAVGAYVGLTALVQDHRLGGSSKLRVMTELLRVTRDHRLTGTGVGGLYAAVSGSASPLAENTVSFAENMAVDLIIGVGPIAALAALGLAAQWLYRNRPRVRSSQPEDFSVFAALVSLIAHDQVDFALWLGASGYMAAVLAGLQSGHRAYVPLARGEFRSEDKLTRLFRNRTRLGALIGVALSAAAGLFTARFTSETDRVRWQEQAQSAALDEQAMRRALVNHPGDPVLPLVGANIALRARDPRALRFVNRAIELAPAWSSTHILLAQVLAARGLRSQALLETRLAATLSARYHPAAARLLLAMQVTDEELDRVVPAGTTGTELLRTLGAAAVNAPRGAVIDERLLARDPTDVSAWTRVAGRARSRGDRAAETRAWEEILRIRPTEAGGCLGLADMHLARTDDRAAVDDAERALGRCALGVREGYEYLRRTAILRARRGDTDGMRRAIDQLLERSGADADQRIAVFALRGQLELELRHESAALSAYELADSMSAPRHPYLASVIRIAHAMGDQGRVRNACMTLREDAELPSDVRPLCNGTAGAAPDRGPAPSPDTTQPIGADP
jgi:hypothetical protein